MKMSINLKDSIKGNIASSAKAEADNFKSNEDKALESKGISGGEDKFKLAKKKEDKSVKKAFNVYMEDNLLKDIDKVAKKSGYSRNELINIMCQWCVDNLEFTE